MTLETDRGLEISCYIDEDWDEQYERGFDFDNDIDKSILPLTDKKSITDEEKSELKHLDFSGTFHIKTTIKPRSQKSLLPEAMNRKIKSVKSEMVVYFFNTNRRIVFTRNELKQHFGEDNKILPKIKNLIPFIVTQYCKLFLYFEPLEVNHQYFELKLANLKNQQDQIIEPFDHEEDFSWLFDCGSLVLIRKDKNLSRILAWQQKFQDGKQILEIIIPFQRELLEKIERHRTINSLKEKIMSSSQLSNIVIVTYHDFKICEGKKKIGQIIEMDRILQVYREKVNKYEDLPPELPPAIKAKPEYTRLNATLINEEFQVNSSLFYGKQYVQIVGSKIIDKYEGGLAGYIFGFERRVERSIFTLVGLNCSPHVVKMEYMTKDGEEILTYRFVSNNQKEEFFKRILRLGRQLNQNFSKICD